MVGDPRRHDQLHPARRVLGVVVVPARLAFREHDLARLGRDRVVAPRTEHSTSRPRAAASTIASASCSNAVSSAAGNSASVAARTIPTEEPSRAGLTNTGRPSVRRSASTRLRAAANVSACTAAVAHLRQAGVGHQLLEHHLVHAQRGGEYAGADVGHVEALEQPLDGAVLAERSVQHREHDVDAFEPTPRLDREA